MFVMSVSGVVFKYFYGYTSYYTLSDSIHYAMLKAKRILKNITTFKKAKADKKTH